jgi:Tfp pilus assembly PilM family ATPase
LNTLSLSFNSDCIRLIELNPEKEIIFIDELEYDLKLENDFAIYIDNEVVISSLAEKVESILEGKKNVSKAGVLIETSQTFLNVIPVDFNEEKSQINLHILWELSNYYPDSYKNFNIKYYRLNNLHVDANIDEVLLIAVDKSRIEFIKKVCKQSGLDVKIIDIDHFAIEKCIKEIYRNEQYSNYILIGCKKNRIDFSLLVSGKLKYYDFAIINNRNLKKVISSKLKLFYSYFSDIDIKKVFIYGEDSCRQVKKYFEETGKLESEFINPFLNFKFKDEINLEESSLSKFAPVYGLALKSFGD